MYEPFLCADAGHEQRALRPRLLTVQQLVPSPPAFHTLRRIFRNREKRRRGVLEESLRSVEPVESIGLDMTAREESCEEIVIYFGG